jgi:predicted DNA-binding transcriptional regulator AlpA
VNSPFPQYEPSDSVARARRRKLTQGLIRRKPSASYCSVGVSTWDRWTAAGLTPAPVKIGGAVMWCRAELAEWCRHGCPPRTEWAPIWATMLSARRAGKS